MPLNVLIFGAGAIGAFFGSRIASSAARVSVVCRSNFKAVKTRGFTIDSPQFGTYTWRPYETFGRAEEARKRWDYVVVSTKALPEVSDDSKLLEGLVHHGTKIVLIQNGLGVEEPYYARFPQAQIFSGVTIASCSQPEAGRIKHNRWTRLNIGPYKCEPNDEFVKLLKDAGIDASAYDEKKMQLLRWHKVAINAAMNPTSVLTDGVDNPSMVKEMAAHIKGVMEEVMMTAQKVVGRFPSDFATPDQILKSTQNSSPGSVPSMQQDWASGRQMELEAILGAPLRIAKENGLEMPRLETLYSLIKMKQKQRDGKSKL